MTTCTRAPMVDLGNPSKFRTRIPSLINSTPPNSRLSEFSKLMAKLKNAPPDSQSEQDESDIIDHVSTPPGPSAGGAAEAADSSRLAPAAAKAVVYEDMPLEAIPHETHEVTVVKLVRGPGGGAHKPTTFSISVLTAPEPSPEHDLSTGEGRPEQAAAPTPIPHATKAFLARVAVMAGQRQRRGIVRRQPAWR
jgi:hypothetical protein